MHGERTHEFRCVDMCLHKIRPSLSVVLDVRKHRRMMLASAVVRYILTGYV